MEGDLKEYGVEMQICTVGSNLNPLRPMDLGPVVPICNGSNEQLLIQKKGLKCKTEFPDSPCGKAQTDEPALEIACAVNSIANACPNKESTFHAQILILLFLSPKLNPCSNIPVFLGKAIMLVRIVQVTAGQPTHLVTRGILASLKP